ncbi:MAG: histidinol-phosphatase, partial [Henriciella sp.]
MSHAIDENEILNLTRQLADAAWSAIQPHFRTGVAIENKASGAAYDPVTVADKAGEEAIRAILVRE